MGVGTRQTAPQAVHLNTERLTRRSRTSKPCTIPGAGLLVIYKSAWDAVTKASETGLHFTKADATGFHASFYPQASIRDAVETRCLRARIVLSNVRGGKNPAQPVTAWGQFPDMRQNDANYLVKTAGRAR